MRTPAVLIGKPDPQTGRPFGAEVIRGLGTKDARAARVKADVLRGEIQRLALAAGGPELTDDRALLYAAAIKAQAEAGGPGDYDPDIGDLVQEEAERVVSRLPAKQRSAARAKADRFLAIASGSRGYPLDKLLNDYLQARAPANPSGYKPLAQTTTNDLRSAFKHLGLHLGRPLDACFLGDVSADDVHRFRTVYLRDGLGLKPQTVAKYVTLLAGAWRWAREERLAGAPEVDVWADKRLVPRARRTAAEGPDDGRRPFTPAEAKALLAGLPEPLAGLFRLLLATGCRMDEVASLTLADVLRPAAAQAATAFRVRSGKTINATRYVPVPVFARGVLSGRVKVAEVELAAGRPGRLFPEIPVKPTTGKAAAASQAFGRERRRLLGLETDGRLSLHSTRHTWRTAARRAGLPDDVVNDLGGWAGVRRSSSTYDHGLLREQLEAAQERIAEQLSREGYLDGF